MRDGDLSGKFEPSGVNLSSGDGWWDNAIMFLVLSIIYNCGPSGILICGLKILCIAFYFILRIHGGPATFGFSAATAVSTSVKSG